MQGSLRAPQPCQRGAPPPLPMWVDGAKGVPSGGPCCCGCLLLVPSRPRGAFGNTDSCFLFAVSPQIGSLHHGLGCVSTPTEFRRQCSSPSPETLPQQQTVSLCTGGPPPSPSAHTPPGHCLWPRPGGRHLHFPGAHARTATWAAPQRAPPLPRPGAHVSPLSFLRIPAPPSS